MSDALSIVTPNPKTKRKRFKYRGKHWTTQTQRIHEINILINARSMWTNRRAITWRERKKPTTTEPISIYFGTMGSIVEEERQNKMKRTKTKPHRSSHLFPCGAKIKTVKHNSVASIFGMIQTHASRAETFQLMAVLRRIHPKIVRRHCCAFVAKPRVHMDCDWCS